MRDSTDTLRVALAFRIGELSKWPWRKYDQKLLLEAGKAINALEDECQASMAEIARERARADRAEAKLTQKAAVPVADLHLSRGRKNYQPTPDDVVLAVLGLIAIIGTIILCLVVP